MLRSNLVTRKLLSESFTDFFEELKIIRECANYSMKPFIKVKEQKMIDLSYIVKSLYSATEEIFDIAFEFIFLINDTIEHKYLDFSIRSLAASFIANSFGDDFYLAYLSEKEEKLVKNYLDSKGLLH